MPTRIIIMLLLVAVLGAASVELNARDPRSFERSLVRQSNLSIPGFVSGEDLEAGMFAPDINVMRADGSSFSSGIIGDWKPVYHFVILFLTACGSCTDDCLLSMQQLEKTHHGVRVVIISESPPGKLSEAARKHKVTIPVLYDKKMTSASAYRIKWGPRAYMVNGCGRIEYVQPSMLTCKETAEILDQVLAKVDQNAK